MSVSYVTATDLVVTLRYDKIDDTTSYLGEAATGASETGAVWKIRKINLDGSNVSILWADGNESPDNIWSNRASLNYS
jgi:hypothetical protein